MYVVELRTCAHKLRNVTQPVCSLHEEKIIGRPIKRDWIKIAYGHTDNSTQSAKDILHNIRL